MNEYLLARVKNSLNKQHYLMNNSWLTDCVEYYLNDHNNPTQEEVIDFVINQWVLSDLREINHENGSLPKNLAKQKFTTLPGRYILQMEKIYDISTSKYKQLEKIRNISSENIEATEKDKMIQEDKFHSFEPKSKRMLQLFLTDGVQDILAVEYKPIKLLKDDLYPGFKVMIKGPVICRRGVLLLEEGNILEVGGEVDNLLISNHAENVFARALNMEENPDPYNDNVAPSNDNKMKSNQGNQGIIDMEDDFDMDLDELDKIEKQVQQQIINTNQNLPCKKEEKKPASTVTKNVVQCQSTSLLPTSRAQNLISIARNNYESNLRAERKKKHTECNEFNIQNNEIDFEDDDSFENFPVSHHNTSQVFNTSSTKKQSSLTKLIENCNQNQNRNQNRNQNQNQNEDDFPMENEIYDFNAESCPFFQTSKPENESHIMKTNSFRKESSSQDTVRSKTISYTSRTSKQIDISPPTRLKKYPNSDLSNSSLSWKLPLSLESMNIEKPSQSNITDYEGDFEMGDFESHTEESKDYSDKNSKSGKNSNKSSQASISSTSRLIKNLKEERHRFLYGSREDSIGSSNESKIADNSLEYIGTQFMNDFGNEFEKEIDMSSKLSNSKKKTSDTETPKTEKMKSSIITSENQISYNSTKESTGQKRLASLSPNTDTRQKIRCIDTTPKSSATTSKKITDFLIKPRLLSPSMPKICELLCDILKQPVPEKGIQTVVRGKVVNIVKLNLFKGEEGSYFHLEGTITDYTGSLDIVFSSKVLENIFGYTAKEFSFKRRQSKSDPTIKDQLRKDLSEVQQTLRVMDVLMEIELKRNKKALVLNTTEMTKEQKMYLNKRVQSFKK